MISARRTSVSSTRLSGATDAADGPTATKTVSQKGRWVTCWSSPLAPLPPGTPEGQRRPPTHPRDAASSPASFPAAMTAGARAQHSAVARREEQTASAWSEWS